MATLTDALLGTLHFDRKLGVFAGEIVIARRTCRVLMEPTGGATRRDSDATDLAAALAVDLQHQFDLILHQRCGVDLWPRRIEQVTMITRPRPNGGSVR